MRAAITLAMLATGLLCAAPAAGSVARVREDPCFPDPHGMGCDTGGPLVLEYQAGPGEQNAVTLTASLGSLVVTDPAASVQAQTGCTQVDAHTAPCPASRAEIHTGDGADRLDLTRVAATADSGDGNDDVSALSGTFRLGAGDDRLTARDAKGDAQVEAGPGDDFVAVAGRATVGGGDGADTISTGDGPEPNPSSYDIIKPGLGNDVISAGPGLDEISYE